MGMLIEGKWIDEADRSMVDGTYRREQSALPSMVDDELISQLRHTKERYFLVASASCPWSHATVITLTLAGLSATIKTQWAGGPRVEGYGLLPGGLLPGRNHIQHVHQLYTATEPDYTGRATVPVLWDARARKIISNSSSEIMAAIDCASDGLDLRPKGFRDEIDALTDFIFAGLSNAVYRAGKAQKQVEYDEAVNTVFQTMDELETRLEKSPYLIGSELCQADIRLFATLVRFDTVYATHFRCTRARLVDYPNLWRYARRIYQLPGVKDTVDFDQIRYGYYVNDGSHNPFKIIAQQPKIDWESDEGLR